MVVAKVDSAILRSDEMWELWERYEKSLERNLFVLTTVISRETAINVLHRYTRKNWKNA